jgi:DNA polymerase III delta subunit
MRIYPKGFPAVASAISNGSVKGVMLYGPDRGMVENFIEEIKNILAIPLRKVEYASVAASSLGQVLNSLSLFDSKEIIVIKNLGQSLDKESKQVLEGQIHNFPILVAEELTPASSLRQFFEKQQAFVAIACYPDTSIDLKSNITAYCRKKGKQVEAKALEYLCENLNNDRQFLYSELDKICAYSNDQSAISFDVVKELVLPSRNISIDKLCIAFARKDAAQYFSELDNLFVNNTAEMLVIRSLIRYYTNIFEVKQSIANGFSLDEAVKFLAPPIFFMYVEQFKSIAGLISKQTAFAALNKLVCAEIDLKSGLKNSRSVLENIFY